MSLANFLVDNPPHDLPTAKASATQGRLRRRFLLLELSFAIGIPLSLGKPILKIN